MDGETLKERLNKGRLPIDQALEYAIQIADALDKAHRKAIVHRDLKPSNIMLTKSGVKLLDFGLAKLGIASAVTPTSEMSTRDDSETLTEEGAILGTLRYMAPEQLEGKEADARTDIFAFGAVVYEMVTGKKAFNGTSQASLIGAILKDEPQPMAEIQEMTPRSLDRVVKKCLAKDPDARWQTVSDLCDEVKWVTETEPYGLPGIEGSHSLSKRGFRRAWAVGVAAVLLLAGITYIMDTVAPGLDSTLELTVLPPTDRSLATVGSLGGTPEISPDGSALLFRSSGGLWLRTLDSINPILLDGTQEASNASFWSSDSRWIAFPTLDRLMKVRTPDGAPELIAEVRGPTRGGSWSDRDEIVVSVVDDGRFRLFQVSPSGGELRPVEVSGLEEGEFFHPQFLPGGEEILFVFQPEDSQLQNVGEVYLATFTDGRAEDPVHLMESSTAVRYTSAGGGRILFIRNDNLYSQLLNVDNRSLEGDAELLVESVGSMPGVLQFTAHFSVSRSGTLAWRPGQAALAQVTVFDRQGEEIATVGPRSATFTIQLSPDETRLSADNWLMEPDQPGRVPLGDFVVGWLPDEGSTPLLEENLLQSAPWLSRFSDFFWTVRALSPDLAELLLSREGSVYAISLLEEPDTARPVVETGENIFNAQFSPDGQWLLYRAIETDLEGLRPTPQIYVQTYQGSAANRRLIATGGFPVWRRDGREIVYVGPESSVWSVPVATVGENLDIGTPERLFPVRIPAYVVLSASPLDVSADGSRFYVVQAVEQPDSDMIHVRVGGFPENPGD